MTINIDNTIINNTNISTITEVAEKLNGMKKPYEDLSASSKIKNFSYNEDHPLCKLCGTIVEQHKDLESKIIHIMSQIHNGVLIPKDVSINRKGHLYRYHQKSDSRWSQIDIKTFYDKWTRKESEIKDHLGDKKFKQINNLMIDFVSKNINFKASEYIKSCFDKNKIVFNKPFYNFLSYNSSEFINQKNFTRCDGVAFLFSIYDSHDYITNKTKSVTHVQVNFFIEEDKCTSYYAEPSNRFSRNKIFNTNIEYLNCLQDLKPNIDEATKICELELTDKLDELETSINELEDEYGQYLVLRALTSK